MTTATARQQLLTVADVADHLQVSRRKVLDLIHKEKLRATNVGGDRRGGKRWRVHPRDLNNCLEAQRAA